jgi:hypothetical protein
VGVVLVLVDGDIGVFWSAGKFSKVVEDDVLGIRRCAEELCDTISAGSRRSRQKKGIKMTERYSHHVSTVRFLEVSSDYRRIC